MTLKIRFKGGPGSGHRGHAGRPGQRGGGRATSTGFRVFTDKRSMHSFLFKSEGLNPSPSPDEELALADYKEDSFPVNVGLRKGGRDASNVMRNMGGDNIRDIIDASSLPEDVVVYRGADNSKFPARNLTGSILTDKAFVSTTLDKDIAIEFSGYAESGDGILFEIRLPAGSKALNMESALGGTSKSFVTTSQFELLLQRGSSFKVLSDVFSDDNREVIMELMQ